MRTTEQIKTIGKLYLKAGYFSIRNNFKQYPRVIQLPITYQCNSKCVMCNIWKMDYSNEINPEELKRILSDKLFKKVTAVGINGGEPSLKKDIVDFAKSILTLPSLKSLNIISHGFNQKQILEACKEIYILCKAKGIEFHISISLDGYGEVHNIVRGMKVFKLTAGTIKEIQENQSDYCDSLDVGCTVVQQNVDKLLELDAYAKENKINIKYRLGIPNKRIESNKLLGDFSVEKDKTLQSAKEFFYSRFLECNTFADKFKYYSIFYNLLNPQRRLLGCDWKYRGVTLDSKGKMFYCAVESDEIGSVRTYGAHDQFFSKKNLEYRDSIIKNKCNECIHDYSGVPTIANVTFFLKEMFSRKLWTWIYRVKVLLT